MSLNEVKFLKVSEVAPVLRCSKMTVYRLIQSGLLPAITIGTKGFRIPEQAVHDYIREAYVPEQAEAKGLPEVKDLEAKLLKEIGWDEWHHSDTGQTLANQVQWLVSLGVSEADAISAVASAVAATCSEYGE